jgi:hypothetical protein
MRTIILRTRGILAYRRVVWQRQRAPAYGPLAHPQGPLAPVPRETGYHVEEGVRRNAMRAQRGPRPTRSGRRPQRPFYRRLISFAVGNAADGWGPIVAITLAQ